MMDIGNIITYQSKKSVKHWSEDFLFPEEKKIIKMLKPTDKVLEVGCGAGRLTKYIKRKCKETTGVDYCPGLIKQARKDYPNIRFEVRDARELRFMLEKFDVVWFSFNGIDYIIPKAEIIKALDDMRRVCEDKGKIMFSAHKPHVPYSIPTAKYLFKWLIGNNYVLCEQSFGNLLTHYGTKRKWKKLTKKAGLKITETIKCPYWNYYVCKKKNYKLSELCHWTLKPFYYAFEWVYSENLKRDFPEAYGKEVNKK